MDLKARHMNLSIISETISIPTFSISNSKSLHSLMLQHYLPIDHSSTKIVPNQFLDLKHLRMLSLSGSLMELPTNIGDLIHLRYLNLFDIGLEFELPPAIGNLLNLQTLRLFQCRVTRLPEEVGKLIHLRYLYADYGRLRWPKGIGRCTSLQTLKRIPCGSDDQYFQLRDFGNLNCLRDIFLTNLGTKEHLDEAREAQLQNKTALVDLSLFFRDDDTEGGQTHTDVLEALKPHPNLTSLLISYYRGPSISPSWMTSLVNLKKLHLRRSHYESLPNLGKLQSLEELVIGRSSSLKRLGPEFLGVEMVDSQLKMVPGTILFPKLKEIFFERAQSLREWDGVPGWTVNFPLKIMPRLQSLTLRDCSSLESLPDFLESTPLEYLSISGSQAMCESCKKETGRDWPKIRHVPNIYVTM
ncbi:LRR domain containing protein [Trema orientale]|uniref:LRR domain containing protein n=1 Tax=Trema orientale TaxID=63057 RepID=A0A2P5FQ56_TREOI|nr:LRR domain containing protein [Trema orientale]